MTDITVIIDVPTELASESFAAYYLTRMQSSDLQSTTQEINNPYTPKIMPRRRKRRETHILLLLVLQLQSRLNIQTRRPVSTHQHTHNAPEHEADGDRKANIKFVKKADWQKDME